jgi:C4-dicarboxylate-specific signal transduction histidine kinase
MNSSKQLNEALRKIRALEERVNTLTSEMKSLKTQGKQSGNITYSAQIDEQLMTAADNGERVIFK